MTTAGGDLDAVVSADGTLAYVPGAWRQAETRTLVWVDRQGRETPIPAPPRAYVQPRLSPDGKRVAVVHRRSGRWISGSRISSAPRSPASHPARALTPLPCGRPTAAR